MGCCVALLATRSSVKVQPASVQNLDQLSGGYGQQSFAVPPPSTTSPVTQDLHHLTLPTTAAAIWSAVESKVKGTADSHCRKKARAANWETQYVYVASVYEDFAEERAFLATHVFPELRQWCAAQQLHLVPVDLRQGLTHSPDTVQFAATCLHELDRYMACKVPMCFIAFISERLGYTPPPEVLGESSVLVSQYGWIEGISLLEMEVVRAAFTRHNPNALFFYRDPSFISKLPLDIAVKYMHSQEKERMEILKAKVQEKYRDQVFQYVVDPCWSNVTGEIMFSGFENVLSKIIVEFFMLRMKKELPFGITSVVSSVGQLEHLEQEEMERASAGNFIGRQTLMGKINEYIEGPGPSVPLLILGETGSGKTTLLANIARSYQDRYSAIKKASQQQQPSPPTGQEEGGKKRRFSVADVLQLSTGRGRLQPAETSNLAKKNLRRKSDFVAPNFLHTRSPGRGERMRRVDNNDLMESEDPSEDTYWSPLPITAPGLLDDQWLVFYHTLGCIPCSDELPCLLQRLWRIEGLGEPRMADMPYNPHALSKAVQEMLVIRGGRKFLLIVDSIDRMKGEYPSDTIKWMPVVLPANVRIIVSSQPTSEVRKVLTAREPSCLELTNGPLGLVQSKLLLKHALQHYRVSPTLELVEVLLNKHGISNPHYVWELCRVLSVAMETPPLTATGMESIMELANVLPNELSGLHDHLLKTFEDGQGKVAIAAVCLLQSARHGLSEVELLEMLGTLFEHGEQANVPGDGSSQRLHQPSTDSALVSSNKFSSSDAASWAGSDTERLSLTESHPSSVGLARSRQELHLPLRGPNAPSSGNRLSPHYPHRKISVTSTPPDWPRSHSPLLMPATPDFSKFGATPSPGSARARHSHHSLSLTPTPNRLSPISGAKPITSPPTTARQAEELHCGLPPAEIEEVVVETKQERSSRPLPTEAQPRLRPNSKLIPLEWAMLLRQLEPFVRNVGKPDQFRWVFSNRAFTRAITKRYFKCPPTQSFPFSFSSTFCGAKDDRSTLHHMSAKGGGRDPTVGARLPGSGRSDGSAASSDTVQKRYMWWHTRLAWYFDTCCADVRRRSEELPYHMMQLQNYGRLSKCLSSLHLLRHLTSPFTVMDLLRYWHCAGGANTAVTAYSQALASLEISGASPQELVTHMKRVALFYHKLGASDSARQLLSDALDVVESRLSGRREMVSDLLYHLVLFLSDTLTEQMGISTPRTLMEPVYRLLKTAGRTVELLRSLDSDTSSERLPPHLLLLSRHLIYYASHGGSAELTARSALEQAQEAAKEAADLFLVLGCPAKSLEALLVLSQAQSGDVFKQLDTLQRAEDVCRTHFSSFSPTMVAILKQVGELLETKVNNREAALLYYRQWHQVVVAMQGEEHAQSKAARDRVREVSEQL